MAYMAWPLKNALTPFSLPPFYLETRGNVLTGGPQSREMMVR